MPTFAFFQFREVRKSNEPGSIFAQRLNLQNTH